MKIFFSKNVSTLSDTPLGVPGTQTQAKILKIKNFFFALIDDRGSHHPRELASEVNFFHTLPWMMTAEVVFMGENFFFQKCLHGLEDT